MQACQERWKSSGAYAPVRGVNAVKPLRKSDANKFRVTVHGSGDGKTLEQVLLEASDLIRELMTKALKAYPLDTSDDNIVDKVNQQIGESMNQ
ncbi:hypothetical protein [Alicyclobacillus mengziensis]|uniref:Uncharacterized protein n=1 Tax=Alicyclobacillus mengziensis TaxID=2931921 RepID=A0A9X7VUP4_9BACL|nr:hypothetical protein [Alicyclobacillus mengziensis]QSO45501.1 hypothetical protein JZ786_13045 [Alicyclobacillus mengziensis]